MIIIWSPLSWKDKQHTLMFQSISSFAYELQTSLPDFIYLGEIYTISRLEATLEPNVKVSYRSHNVHLLSKREGVYISSLFEVLK